MLNHTDSPHNLSLPINLFKIKMSLVHKLVQDKCREDT